MIKIIFNEHKSRYGSTRIFHELKARGIPCTRAKIAELMNDMNLIAKARKKYKVTTDSNHNKQVAPNLLEQDFRATEPNENGFLILHIFQLAKGGYTSAYLLIYSLDR